MRSTSWENVDPLECGGILVDGHFFHGFLYCVINYGKVLTAHVKYDGEFEKGYKVDSVGRLKGPFIAWDYMDWKLCEVKKDIRKVCKALEVERYEMEHRRRG